MCKQLRYAWNSQSNSFEQLQGLDVNIMNSFYYKQLALNRDEQLARRLIYGNNEITVPYKDLKTLLFLEILNPFYVFQMFSVLLWCSYNYYYYAGVIVMMTVTGIMMSIRQTKKVRYTNLSKKEKFSLILEFVYYFRIKMLSNKPFKLWAPLFYSMNVAM